MNFIELLALILVCLSVVKLLVFIAGKKVWVPIARALYSNYHYAQFAFMVFVLGLLYWLLKVYSIVEIFAFVLLSSFLFGIRLAPYAKDLLGIMEKRKGNPLLEFWWYILFWLVLCSWVVFEIFK